MFSPIYIVYKVLTTLNKSYSLVPQSNEYISATKNRALKKVRKSLVLTELPFDDYLHDICNRILSCTKKSKC